MQLPSPEDQSLAMGVSQELDLQPATAAKKAVKFRAPPRMPRKYRKTMYNKRMSKKELARIRKVGVTQPSTTLVTREENEAQHAFELYELGRISHDVLVTRINKLQKQALKPRAPIASPPVTPPPYVTMINYHDTRRRNTPWGPYDR